MPKSKKPLIDQAKAVTDFNLAMRLLRWVADEIGAEVYVSFVPAPENKKKTLRGRRASTGAS